MSDQQRDYADKAMRDALLKPDNLRDFLHAAVPTLADGFDFTRVHSVPPQFLLPDGRGREADLLFEIPYRTANAEQLAFVCVLIEHQTRPDPRMALRMLLYVVLYWEKQWSTWEALPAPKPEFRLPPVLPIVFLTGPRSWGSARSIAELLGEPEVFHPFAPIWAPLFWELPEHSVDELLSADEAFVQMLAVVRVEDADRDEFERVFRETWQRLDRLQESNHIRWADLIYLMIGWITHRRPKVDHAHLFRAAENLASHSTHAEKVQNMIVTIADGFRSEGGMREAKKIVMRQGTKRWGPPGTDIETALNAIEDIDRLERIAERVIDAASWVELMETS